MNLIPPNRPGLQACLLAATALGAFFLATAPPVRSAPGGLKIAYVDVFAASKQSKSIQQIIQTARDEVKLKQDELKTVTDAYESAKAKIESNRSTLTPQALEAEVKSLRGLEERADLLRVEIDREVRRKNDDVVQPAVDRIMETVRRLARLDGVDLVLRSDSVVFGTESLDLTGVVVQELDRLETDRPAPAGALKGPVPPAGTRKP